MMNDTGKKNSCIHAFMYYVRQKGRERDRCGFQKAYERGKGKYLSNTNLCHDAHQIDR